MEVGVRRAREAHVGTLVLNVTVLVFFLALVNVVATQYIGRAFGYHPSLGKVFYWPWMWLVWSFRHYQQHSAIFNKAYLFVAVTTIFAFGFYAFLLAMFQRRSKGHDTIHGTAHFASKKEVLATGLLGARKNTGRGVYVGGWREGGGRIRYLRHDGPEHIMAVAPTRSGKGVCLIVPTLLSWPHSLVCLDIKGENWALTAGWRKRHAGSVVLKFDPTATDDTSVKFNPLEEIRLETEYEVADVQNIATMIVDPDGKGLNDHWAKTGHALLVGAILHCLYIKKREGKTASLTDVANLLSNPKKSIEETLKEMLETEHRATGAVHEVVAASARDMLNKAEQERSGVLSTAMSFLTLYRDPIIAKNTAASEFKIRDLMHRDEPVSLYLIVRPSDKDRLKPLIRLVVNQIVRILAEKMEFKDGAVSRHYRHRLLLMLDEFPSLGRLDVFQESLAYLAGYGLKAYLIIQDFSQLHAAYGRDESIMSNCHVRIAFAPNKIETAELLSKMSGTATVIKKSFSTSGKRFGAILGHVSESTHEVQRPLLTPDECMRLPGPKKDDHDRIVEPGDMLIYVAGNAPIYGRQILYFKDPVFSARAKVRPPERSDRIHARAERPRFEFKLA